MKNKVMKKVLMVMMAIGRKQSMERSAHFL